MIFGYPDEPTVLAGGRLTLRVSTDAPEFRVEFHRWGDGLTFQGRSPWWPGRHAPAHPPYQDWGQPGTGLRGEELAGWPAYHVAVPGDWPSGVYLAILVEGDGRGRAAHRAGAHGAAHRAGAHGAAHRADARQGRALFVVRHARPESSILYKLPLLTYHAYNRVTARGYDPATGRGGWCLYTVPPPGQVPVPVPPTVSVRRPGGGVGGTPWDVDNFDPFDPSPRQTFAHWDAPFIAWLERTGRRVDYCTDLDLHRDVAGDLLEGYRLLLSVGHDEYWTDAMRTHVERFVRAGANVAFFGGNTCWWRVEFDGQLSFRRVSFWSDVPAPGRPENILTGVSFRNGGERDRDNHPVAVGYRAQHTDHWVYEGTGLRDGNTFGDRPDEYLVGYECDGAHFDRGRLARGLPIRPTGDDGTPAGFTILGVGDLAVSGWGLGNAAATMGLHTDHGTVFTAATTDWARVLGSGRSPVVERITRNVLDRLG
ncbi:N,N-dimethylformamidase beta subunit family domain-containing protein [Planosporangium sp. 12N6]|uniref:N,N-dimethylformamidase beta subunit family domain-containing protein n=1 Tax=Planosporangium spinosum TaxID=3402278 RepID=UPI003CF37DAE